MVTAGQTNGTAQLAATASTMPTPDSRSKTVSLPVLASTAVILRSRSGHSSIRSRALITSIRSAPPGRCAASASRPILARLARLLPGTSTAGSSIGSRSLERWASFSCRGGRSWASYRSSRVRPLVMWAPTTEPALVPTTRSAVVRSTPASASPFRIPSSQAMPVTPPPPRTSAVRVMGVNLVTESGRLETPLDLRDVARPGAQDRVAEVGAVRGVGKELGLQRDAVTLPVDPAGGATEGAVEHVARVDLQAGLVGGHLEPSAGLRALQG